MHGEKCAKNQVFINELNANPADIVRLYEALCSCDSPRLLDAVLDVEIGQKARGALPAGRKEMLLCRLTADLEVMRNLDPGSSSEGEVVELGKLFEKLSGIPWTKALAMYVWMPESLAEHERYLIMGQAFSAITCGGLSKMLLNAA